MDMALLSLILVTMVALIALLEWLYPLKKNLQRRRHFPWDLTNFMAALAIDATTKGPIHGAYVRLAAHQSYVDLSVLHWSLKVPLTLLLSDFLLYWLHRCSHRNRWLWLTHRWHHSTTELYWFSGLRSSVVEVVIYAAVQIFAGTVLFRLEAREMTAVFSVGFFFQLWSHSNVKTPTWLNASAVFVTPEFHHPHHAEGDMLKKNYGAMFSIWDRLFKTAYKDAPFSDTATYGLTRPAKSWRMLLGF